MPKDERLFHNVLVGDIREIKVGDILDLPLTEDQKLCLLSWKVVQWTDLPSQRNPIGYGVSACFRVNGKGRGASYQTFERPAKDMPFAVWSGGVDRFENENLWDSALTRVTYSYGRPHGYGGWSGTEPPVDEHHVYWRGMDPARWLRLFAALHVLKG